MASSGCDQHLNFMAIEYEMVNCSPPVYSVGGVKIASRLRYVAQLEAAGGGQETRGLPRVSKNGIFDFPPTLVEIFIRTWTVQAR